MRDELTVDELNRAIAERCEPSPRWEGQPLFMSTSDNGFWQGKFSSNGGLEISKPIDFTTDSKQAFVLIELMLLNDEWVTVISSTSINCVPSDQFRKRYDAALERGEKMEMLISFRIGIEPGHLALAVARAFWRMHRNDSRNIPI